MGRCGRAFTARWEPACLAPGQGRNAIRVLHMWQWPYRKSILRCVQFLEKAPRVDVSVTSGARMAQPHAHVPVIVLQDFLAVLFRSHSIALDAWAWRSVSESVLWD